MKFFWLYQDYYSQVNEKYHLECICNLGIPILASLVASKCVGCREGTLICLWKLANEVGTYYVYAFATCT